MRFTVGSRVKLNEDFTTTRSGTFPKGSKGTVMTVFPTLEVYLIQFDQFVNRAKVPETSLDPA